MKAWAVIGWVYEADLHCPECAEERFPGINDSDSEKVFEDREGNEPSPIFASNDHDPAGEYCGDCGAELWEPEEDPEEWEPEERYGK